MKKKEEELHYQIGETLVDKNEQLVEITTVDGTPFTIVSVSDQGHFVAIGRNRLTEFKESKEDALKEIDVNNWEFLLSLVIGLIKTISTDKDLIEEFTVVNMEN